MIQLTSMTSATAIRTLKSVFSQHKFPVLIGITTDRSQSNGDKIGTQTCYEIST